jgi:hypothetical protein
MALWALAWLGSTPVGGPIVGWVGQVAGARWSLVIGGVSTLVCGLLTWRVMGRIDRKAEMARGAVAARSDGQTGTVRELEVAVSSAT